MFGDKTKKIVGLVILFVTFAVGLFVVGIIRLSAPIPNIDAPKEYGPTEINPCSLVSNSEVFLNKEILVQATLYRYDRHILVYPNIYSEGFPAQDCGTTDYARGYFPSTHDLMVWTELNLEQYAGPNAELPVLFRSLRAGWEIDVEIQGYLSKQPPTEDGSTYKLTPVNLRLVGPWRRFTPKGSG